MEKDYGTHFCSNFRNVNSGVLDVYDNTEKERGIEYDLKYHTLICSLDT